jgi:hypothetical protein
MHQPIRDLAGAAGGFLEFQGIDQLNRREETHPLDMSA